MDILRFTTAGSVDDGKSTLIGRLLYDSKSILQDQYEAIERSSQLMGDGSAKHYWRSQRRKREPAGVAAHHGAAVGM